MSEVFLRDVIHIPESVHSGNFKIELSGGFTDTAARVSEYVVTDQIKTALGKAMRLVRAALKDGNSQAAYLHGSYGAGKSHFLTVLHAILNNDPAARAKPRLQPVIAEHDEWLRNKRFLMVPFHLVGAADLDSALLGGYVATVRALHPDSPTPPVYRADAMLVDARRQREFLGSDAKFADWLGTGADLPTVHDPDDLAPIDGAAVSAWTTTELDRAFAAPAGDPVRDALISALLSGPMSSYVRGAIGDTKAFLPLEDGLSIISTHARDLGYDGVVLFLDELILWLQANITNQRFVNTQVSKLVKLIESGVADRPVPIVSFISRQRDLSKLVGEDVTGADVKNLETQVNYLAGRVDVISLEDRNLPAIIKERILKPFPGKEDLLRQAFASIDSTKGSVKDVLLDANGVTGADWDDFRSVYPLSPALLNVLVALSGALQRERTGLKLLEEMLYRRRADFTLGQLFPLGDLWDVLVDGTGEAFTDKLRRESEAAARFHTKVQAHLLAKYESADDARFKADDRLVKTLMLAALAPTVPALARLTGARLAALNYGSIRSRTTSEGAVVVSRLRELQAEFGELRADGAEDPVFALHLSDLDIEPLLDAVGEIDRLGARRIWVKNQLWTELNVTDTGSFVCEREIIWRGTRRVAEFVFDNVRDSHALADAQFTPSVEGRIRFVLDYPFDAEHDRGPSDDANRVRGLMRAGHRAATIVWLPHFLNSRKSAQLGRLLKIQHLLERDRLDDYGSHLSADDRIRVRHQLEAQRDNLTSQLIAYLRQLYGIAQVDEVGPEVPDGEHVMSLQPGHRPRLQGGADFEYNMLSLADELYAVLYPKHPDFDPSGSRKPLSPTELRVVLSWITKAAENSNREVVDRKDLALVKRVVHPLELGEVHDGPLILSPEWRRRIDRQAAAHDVTGDYGVEDIRRWIEELGYTGLDKSIGNLIIAVYALLADRAWLYQSSNAEPPVLEKIGTGWSLRAQRLPTPQRYELARTRAGAIFGLHAPDALLARNVARLADEVRAKAVELEPAVLGVRQSLHNHAAALGLAEDADRVASTTDAADLLAGLVDHADPTALLDELAGAEYGSSDAELASASTQAPAVLAALDRVEWALLTTVRGYRARTDSFGDRAQRLTDEIGTAANAHEFTRALAPVLDRARASVIELITDVAKTATQAGGGANPLPRSPVEVVDPVPAAENTPVQGGLENLPRSRGTRTVTASGVESAVIDALRDYSRDIATYTAANPDSRIEIDVRWRPAGPAHEDSEG
ncbi:PglY protein [Actinokineospora sp. NBRC 105648]|uniref:PglY protein n=1 Tax=Actinokineospora sp. NBRC 105648 TaxID=3032206 RepID=UPI0024A57A8B|nr:PglY protein [Actinokineospora sp. NBRC 105648]GLZ41161.1 hypothetical protein Acsp05_47850 [Actinokineospora sp. NBRC 105648]